MSLARFEAYYSRPIAPTRRVALGAMQLPVDPAPGFGGILLGGIVARFSSELDEDVDDEVEALLADLEAGRHVGQPRLRHRLQRDRVGLARCRHELIADGERLRFVFQPDIGTPAQHIVCAVYAAASVGYEARGPVFAAMRKGLRWLGPADESLIRYLSDRRSLSTSRGGDPAGWARTLLGVEGAPVGPELEAAVARGYRERLIRAHPDHGGSVEEAADRIIELREARRILLGS